MRLAVLLLLLGNLLAFGWQQGLFGRTPDPQREPQRLARQIAPDAIVLLAAGRDGPPHAAAPATCLEFGNFDEASLPRARALLDEIGLADRLEALSVEAPPGCVVYRPPAASRADAERAAQRLRERGIQDLIVMGPASPTPNAILLGSFRDRALAQRHQADLERRGLAGVQVGERAAGGRMTRFRIRGLDEGLAGRLATVRDALPDSELVACGG